MKANRKFKSITEDAGAYTKVIGGIVALLLTIIIGVMVYYEVSDGVDQFSEQTETFTGYTALTSNASALVITLDNSPDGASNCNVTCYNATASANLSYPAFSLNHKVIRVAADAAHYYTQVNVTYTGHAGTDEATTTSMAGTVFTLLPIVALVIVAAIILGVVLGFGGTGKSGGGL